MPTESARWDDEILPQIEAWLAEGKSWRFISRQLGIARSSLQARYDRHKLLRPEEKARPERIFRENKDAGEATLEMTTTKLVRTEQDAIEAAGVDLAVWYVHSWECRQWTTPLNVKQGQERITLKKPIRAGKKVETHETEALRWRRSKSAQQQQYLVALKLHRKSPEVRSVETLLEEVARKGRIKLPAYRMPRPAAAHRALEISIMDPHLGLRCFTPAADASWSIDEAEAAFMATVERLLRQAKSYGPFEEVVCPIGNDYFHADTVFHTTTAGTAQPEMDSLHHVYVRGEKLMLWYTERLRRVGAKTLRVLSVPGNHDRFSAFTMARLVRAFYAGAKCKTVDVDASASPYKFWSYGVNLIGFEHGHSVSAIRLAALMANETRLNHWRDARYCEWHLGDQHRKASGKPSTFEEQGVSVEYLPSLTPPNEWHRLKGFNHQKRGAMAFVYDREAGPVARLQVNISSYDGKIMG